MKKCLAKLRGCIGESIAETLVALLISSLALLMLAGAVATASRIVDQSKHRFDEYFEKDAALVKPMLVKPEATNPVQEVSLKIEDKDKDKDKTIVQTLSIVQFSNDTFSTEVNSYVVKDGISD